MRFALLFVLVGLPSCATPEKDCEEYCRYARHVGACIDACRSDGGDLCGGESDACLEPEE